MKRRSFITMKEMADGSGQISIPIDEKLEEISEKISDSTIRRVPEHLRNENVEAYKPQMVAIGPFTYELRCQNHFKEMEECKTRYLQNLLKRRENTNETSYFKAMKELEGKTRSCYSEPISRPDSNEFVEMMLLDACFIVELFRKCALQQFDDSNDRVIQINWIRRSVGRDLLLADNQLPFFVLEHFYNMTKMPNERGDLYGLILAFYGSKMQGPRNDIDYSVEHEHLLSFIYLNFQKIPSALSETPETFYWNLKLIRCATELQEAGIEFKGIEGQSLFAIEFDKGIMKIPVLAISGGTEFLFRNFTVYELSRLGSSFFDYIKFMDCLINSSKDVKLLRESNILINYLGDDEVVAKIFNRLADHVMVPTGYHYAKLFKEVNRYCEKPYHKWMAKLRQNYFNTPWTVISFFAALLLLILTVVQTVFSVLSYFH